MLTDLGARGPGSSQAAPPSGSIGARRLPECPEQAASMHFGAWPSDLPRLTERFGMHRVPVFNFFRSILAVHCCADEIAATCTKRLQCAEKSSILHVATRSKIDQMPFPAQRQASRVSFRVCQSLLERFYPKIHALRAPFRVPAGSVDAP